MFKTRWFVVFAVVVWSVITLLPNFFPPEKKAWWLPESRLQYGLDIQGGLHLVMGVDTPGALRDETRRQGLDIKRQLTEDKVNVTSVDPAGDGLSLEVTLGAEGDYAKTKEVIEKYYFNLQEISRSGAKITYRQSDAHQQTVKRNAVEQAIETLRNRVDEFGVTEPSITAQGDDRILIQLPLRDINDVTRAKDLISRTARLEFNVVSKESVPNLPDLIKEAETKGTYSLETMPYSKYIEKLNDDLKGKIPEKTKVLFERAANAKEIKDGKIPYLLETTTDLTGEMLQDAGVTFGEFGDPQVSLNFSPEGGTKFADLTAANVNRNMAIVLDQVVYSAPNIKERIGGGRAVITLGGGRDQQGQMEEAKMIATALRAGALPARLEQLEERTVGPSLGADSIAAGVKAAYFSTAFVFLFMIFIYRSFGFIADMALGLNTVMLLAMLSALDATLTLPGICGIALSLGMSVDANVIINERIKDELKKGASFEAAIREGYQKAFGAIFDGNVTAIATSVILFYFGTGPIRGFATTLILGLTASMFTAIFFTRIIVDTLVLKWGYNRLNIGLKESAAAQQAVRA